MSPNRTRSPLLQRHLAHRLVVDERARARADVAHVPAVALLDHRVRARHRRLHDHEAMRDIGAADRRDAHRADAAGPTQSISAAFAGAPRCAAGAAAARSRREPSSSPAHASHRTPQGGSSLARQIAQLKSLRTAPRSCRRTRRTAVEAEHPALREHQAFVSPRARREPGVRRSVESVGTWPGTTLCVPASRTARSGPARSSSTSART